MKNIRMLYFHAVVVFVICGRGCSFQVQLARSDAPFRVYIPSVGLLGGTYEERK